MSYKVFYLLIKKLVNRVAHKRVNTTLVAVINLESRTKIMRIIYDISVLGLGYYHLRARTGVFRVVENIAYGLVASRECDLNFSASVSLETLNQSLDYLKSNSNFDDIPFIVPGIEKNIYITLTDIVTKINNKPKVGLSLKALRKSLHYLIKFVEANTQLVALGELYKNDLFHSPFHPLPNYMKKEKYLQRFLTVYDLIPILYPQYFEFQENHLIEKSIQSLDADDWVICISNSTKDDLCNYRKNIAPSKIFVTHLAASDSFSPCYDSEKIAVIKSRYHVPSDVPYILSLSTLEPRKNIDHTIRCFARLVNQEHIKNLYLVLVGAKGWNYSKIFAEVSNYDYLQEHIIVTGYVADEDLAALYSGALTFVYPSFYEGFGLPPLEAMQCGVPVITSNTSSLPEVVGDAGIMVSPTDADALCHSMLEIYNRPSLREAMSLKSIEQAKQFSWQKCTQETITAYKTALSS